MKDMSDDTKKHLREIKDKIQKLRPTPTKKFSEKDELYYLVKQTPTKDSYPEDMNKGGFMVLTKSGIEDHKKRTGKRFTYVIKASGSHEEMIDKHEIELAKPTKKFSDGRNTAFFARIHEANKPTKKFSDAGREEVQSKLIGYLTELSTAVTRTKKKSLVHKITELVGKLDNPKLISLVKPSITELQKVKFDDDDYGDIVKDIIELLNEESITKKFSMK
jgi:hypothetical protein